LEKRHASAGSKIDKFIPRPRATTPKDFGVESFPALPFHLFLLFFDAGETAPAVVKIRHATPHVRKILLFIPYVAYFL
jgi:hypothetical protein